MPEYRWIAVDVDGNESIGTQWAPSEAQLINDLQERNLQIHAIQRARLAFIERMSRDEVAQFFEQLNQLLQAGLLISPSLAIVAQYGSSLRCKIAKEIHACVQNGMSFADALALFPACFTPLIVTLARAGAQAGALGMALEQLCVFLRMQQDFSKQVRSAIASPLMTLAFFFVVVLVIFIGIVPSLEHVVQTLGNKPTGSIETILSLSHTLSSISIFGAFLILLSSVFAVWLISRVRIIQHLWGWVLLHIPVVGSIYVSFTLASFFHALSLLLKGGQPIVAAIDIAAQLVSNEELHERAFALREQTAAGVPLAVAFSTTFGKYASVSTVALLEVGTQTGTLAVVADRCALLYAETATKKIKRMVLVIQPLLMILLGLLVAGLMYAVYVPLMQLPTMVQEIH